MLPISPGAASAPSSSRMRTSQPGAALVGEPGLIGSSSMPGQLAAMAQPVSVCHQWSITGTPSVSPAHASVSGSHRSPARKRYLSVETS